ncbi:erythromycin esterase family protein [Glycomyces arizonensis]|uniref:erythromycin esterase family protein n=1 Tax=Glycomyces arizonensis TaxID=256035 RepID=UPI0004042BBB|nr:erythromycin esterase family protein [Glycomyces arizonensis]
MPNVVFRDRGDAGHALAALLDPYRGRSDTLVLGLPRGGVPVAYEVARALRAPLDVFTVRKLGVPGHEELAMGAIASGGVEVLNDEVVRLSGVDRATIDRVAEREGEELRRRERAYRGERPPPDVSGRTVLLVDDGLATGSTMRAAIRAVRSLGPAGIVVAVPTGSAATCRELGGMVDEMVCATNPEPFSAVGQSYREFGQTSDAEVEELLASANGPDSEEAADPPRADPPDAGSAVAIVRAEARPVADGLPDDDTWLDLVGDARFVLLGEASHGSEEFYSARERLTRRLIEERGFRAVAVEADWPDAYRVNRYVRGHGGDRSAEEALLGFERFPTWMWRNTAVVRFAEWLRVSNDRREPQERTGFYGLDLYSLYRSIHEVIAYLERVDPDAAARARERYACLDHRGGGDDGQAYGYAAAFGAGERCEQEVTEQLLELQRRGVEAAKRDGLLAEDERFYAERNAHTVRAAEEYYRSMFGGSVDSWNLRDTHMVDTLDALAGHLSERRGEPAKIVVWAHNSHLGDARATDSAERGEVNVGQLVRERHPGESRSVGFTTYTGTVTAADDWGGPALRKRVRPGLGGSVEELFHQVGQKEFLVRFDTAHRAAEVLSEDRLERAIGVVYRPETERLSHYFPARPAEQFDAVIHIDETRALEPLERTPHWERDEAPETYPFKV